MTIFDAEEYIEAVRENVRTGDREDGRGEPVEDLNEDEVEAIRDFIGRFAASGGEAKGLHCTLEVGSETRKSVLVFFGILPLLRQAAAKSGKSLVYLSATGETESRARNDQRRLRVLTPVECETWDSAVLCAEHGKLRDFWIIGDLDWGASPGNTERIRQGISMSRMAGASILLHRTGDRAIVDPAKAGKTGCLLSLLIIPLLVLLLAGLL